MKYQSGTGTALLAVWFGLGLLVGCSADTADAVSERNALKEALLKRDAAFARLAADEGVAAAYQEFLAESAVQLPDGGLPVIGRAAIYENIVASLADDDILLSWVAEDADVSAAGDLGYTWGNYYFEGYDEVGEIFRNEGKYVNIWRRESGGDWQVVLDISNQNEIPFIEPIEFDLEGPVD